jgi:predicted ABC-type ATPase
MPTLYIIAGCNGAGKTTASKILLPEVLGCKEFVNADTIAAGLSPFQPETVAFLAGRLMLERINQHLNQKIDFAIETTLATKSYVGLVKQAQKEGYCVSLIFLWINSSELAVQRVKKRVSEGGHDIPTEVIYRRYYRGLHNFLFNFIKIVNDWVVYDNSQNPSEIIAAGNLYESIIYDEIKWLEIKNRAIQNEQTT